MKTATLCVVVSASIILCGCSQKLAEYPVEANDYFEYKATDNPGKQYGVEGTLIFRIATKDAQQFSVRRVSKAMAQNGAQQLFEDPKKDIIYDLYGRIIATADPRGPGKNKGRFSSLWLPPEKRSAGAVLKTQDFFKQQAKISGPEEWNGWNVWVAEILHYKRYYDQETGFLVGWTDSVRPMKLVGSNRL